MTNNKQRFDDLPNVELTLPQLAEKLNVPIVQAMEIVRWALNIEKFKTEGKRYGKE